MPRVRPRKPRLSRMDAAVDAMLPYGFTEEQVRNHVKELLKAYGGDEGWPFIEDSSYRELVEAILRDEERDVQEQVEQGGNQMIEDRNQMKDQSIGDQESSATSTRALCAPQDERPQENALVDIATVANPSPEPFCSTPAESDGKGWKDILPHQTSGIVRETAIVVARNDIDSPSKFLYPRICLLPASPSDVPSSRPTRSRRRQPCYGWIESDDEDDPDDLIYLKPASGLLGAKATLPQELSKCSTDARRKRKSRWDEKP